MARFGDVLRSFAAWVGRLVTKQVTTRWVAALLIVAAPLVYLAGWWIYDANHRVSRIISVELGGSGQALPLPTNLRHDLDFDFIFILGYAIALGLGMILASSVFWTPQARALLRIAPRLAAVGVLADLLENSALLLAVRNGGRTRWLDVATAFSVLKFCALIIPGAVALVGVVVAAGRLIINTAFPRIAAVDTQTPPPLEGDPLTTGVTEGDDLDDTRWRRGYSVPGLGDTELCDRFNTEVVGICLSGGGVRSASVAVGAMQTLRDTLVKARYLVSVSGGGYTAGALQLALTQAPPLADDGVPMQVVRAPKAVLMPGSVEADRFRRHADYLADSPQQMIVALGVLARVMLVSLGLVLSTAVLSGVVVGRAYRAVPLVPRLAHGLHPAATNQPFFGVRAGTAYLLVGLASLSLLFYIMGLLIGTWPSEYKRNSAGNRWSSRFARGSRATTSMFLLVAVVTFVVPAVVYGAVWVMSRYGTPKTTIGGSVGTLLLTYFATLLGVGRSNVAARIKGLISRKSTIAGAAPSGALRLAMSVLTIGLLAAVWLLLFGGAAGISDEPAAFDAAIVIAVLLLVLGLLLDQTELSLHPFYRRRLAAAFDARRVRRSDGYLEAAPYRYDELTKLSTHGTRPADFPEVIFAAAANLTGEHRAPLSAASFTMTGNWLGGPDVGYMRTDQLESAVRGQMQRDLTVEAAVAISGAAVASAMGRESRWYGTLLALSGVRLGTWLPNPLFVSRWSTAVANDNKVEWHRPGLPSIRRMTYLLREILGIHQYNDRLLQITDGGHYENLGLVELLRRRCTTIYCIDASGDAPPTAGTLADALSLAYAELGVSIKLEDAWKLVPGSTTNELAPSDPLASLNSRLSESAVITAKFTYPSAALPSDRKGRPLEGKLIVAKALLTSRMSYDLLSYASRNAAFPHDSTGDQFFNDDKYCAYTQLGRQLGVLAREAASTGLSLV